MEKITVPFITGDGVGAEVTPSMQAVVNAAVKKSYGCLLYTSDAADEL